MKKIKKRSKLSRIITSGALTLCLIAGALPFTREAYAASSFTSDSPFSGTSYGQGADDKTYMHSGTYNGDLIVNGVDVSWWQAADTDWVKAKADGVDFAILRVSYTSLSNPFRTIYDTHFKTLYNNMREAGIDLAGVYAYSQAKTENEAAAEARFAVKRLKKLGIEPEDLELPVYMDYEFGGGRLKSSISRARATSCAKAFCEVIRNEGYKPGIYASTSFYERYINIRALGEDVDIWCAQYYFMNTLSPVYSKWQYSSSAKIDGIISTTTGKIGGTDVDFWYIDQTQDASSDFRIYGNTYVHYTGEPVVPAFDVYYDGKLLEEGRDYTVCGISNLGKASGASTAYAYINGIGKYGGYAVVPYRIKSTYKEHIGLDNKYCEDSEGLIISNRHIFEEVPKYLVRFVDEDGKDIAEPEYYQAGASADDVTVPEPEKKDSVFTGWLDENGNPVETVEDIDGPATYTAVFEPEEAEEETEKSEEVSEETLPEDKAEESDPLPEEITELVDTGETYLDLDIGYTSKGSYIRNVPAGTTADELINAIEIREGYEDYSLKVLNANFNTRTAEVSNGYVLAVYKGEDLVGTACITVNGSTINDTCSVQLGKASAPKVTVAKTSVKKLKKYRKAFKVTVSEKSTAFVSGYQVRYSTRKNMTGAKKKTIGTSAGETSKKITGLKAKKKYYVQVRSYKIVNGKKYYSEWSAVKSVKTK